MNELVVRLRIRRRFWGRFNFARRMEWQRVLTLIEPSSSDRVCDVGCGNGTYTHMMAPKVRVAHGVDLSVPSLRLATGDERPPNCLFECANAERLPFRSAVFDKVFSICTFEHLENDSLALQEVERLLKPDGLVVLTLDSFSYPPGVSHDGFERDFEERGIRQVYRLPEAAEWVEETGLVVEEAGYLVRSPLSAWFYRLGSRLGYGQSPFFVALFPILYPLAVLSDRVMGSEQGGYLLALLARKPTSRSDGSRSELA